MIQPVKEIKSIGKFKVKISLHSEVEAEIMIICKFCRNYSIIIQIHPQLFLKFKKLYYFL